MNKFVKSVLALGISSALCLSAVQAATYKVIDQGPVDSLKYTYIQEENSSGQKAMSGTGGYNFPVQFQYLDDDDFTAIQTLASERHESVFELKDLEDFDTLKAGTPTANDLSWTILYLQQFDASSLYQKFGDVVAMTDTGNGAEPITLFDTVLPGSEIQSRSTQDFINGITADGWIYGNASAPYLPVPFTKDDGEEVNHWLRDFSNRAYISTDNGINITRVDPPEETYGGISGILGMNDNRVAVGFASVKVGEDVAEFIENIDGGCVDPDLLKDKPKAACVQERIAGAYHQNAYKWTFDESGVMIAAEDLGQLISPHADDKNVYSSYAQAINNSGVVVGFADGWDDETVTEPSSNELQRYSYAVVYKDGNVIDISGDHDNHDMVNGRAYDINDNGIAVGHVGRLITGQILNKFFYVDTNTDEMTMVMPTDYFTGSQSTARAINDNGFIVGEGEVETHDNSTNNVPRRRHAFLYDINTDTFENLNSFLSCDSAYTVIEARDINNANEISGTALVKTPRRDSKGELMLDENGEQIEEDVLRAVKLVKITGEQENCDVVVEQVARKGAGFGFMSVFLLLGLAIRRKLI
jgi:hypothetical protein